MNTVTINGVESPTIRGLLIQSLPPISKPPIRTLVEEIDGRDGEITTKLGYAAYDKAMIIGLHGGYDIDEVISFFDSEGEIIFSNEPDKIYRFLSLQQIDFERLLRFRTATVTFRVQPFKHSAIEGTATLTAPTSKVLTIRNNGNVYSRPTIGLKGSGTVNLSINGEQLFAIALDGEILIDGEEMNAYKGSTLANRSADGDYDNLKFNVGKNTVTWTGNVTEITLNNYSRWI